MATHLYPAEALLPGHPDRLADAIADGVVEEACRRDPEARCRVQVTIHGTSVWVTGSVQGREAREIDVPALAGDLLRDVGLAGPLEVRCDIDFTPPEEGSVPLLEAQTIQHGYAVDLPGTQYLPPEYWLAQQLARQLFRLGSRMPELRLGPAGRLIVLVEEDRLPTRLAGVSVTLQQAPEAPGAALQQAAQRLLAEELAFFARLVPGFDAAVPDAVAVHEALRAPVTGHSGRHPALDAYGPRVPVGGPGLAGLDLAQPARAVAVLARRLAKAVVLTGTARECHAVLTVTPGQEEAQVLSLRGDGQLLDASRWGALLDRSLASVAARHAGRVRLPELSRFGTFTSPEFPWEQVHFDGRP